jgi:hypothetical protein
MPSNTLSQSKIKKSIRLQDIQDHYSAVFIGAGIGSLYSAYQWCKHYPDRSNVIIVEQSGRIGGRIQTIHRGNSVFESGAGRFNMSHKLLIGLLKELGLERKMVPVSSNVQYVIDGVLLKTTEDVQRHYGLDKTIDDIWKYIYASAKTDLANRERASTMTLYEYMHTIGLSKNEIQAIKETFGYTAEIELLNAKHAIDTLGEDFIIKSMMSHSTHTSSTMESVKESFYVLKGGLEQVTNELVKRLRAFGVQFLLNTECYWVESYSSYCRIHLRQYPNEHFCLAEQCIVGCPSSAIRNIEFTSSVSPRRFSQVRIPSRVLPKGYPLYRIYARYPVDKHTGKAWFDGIPKTITDLPISLVIPIDYSSGLIMISYTDGPKTKFWNKFSSQEELIAELHRQLAILFPSKRIPNPLWLSYHYWNEGCHVWTKRNHGENDGARLLNEFERKLNHTVFWVNEACSYNHQGWIEGSLLMSKRWLEIYHRRSHSLVLIGGSEPVYTRQEVARHNTIEDSWTIIDGGVYDITKWIPKHPGGVLAIMQIVGKDGTRLFMNNPIHIQKGAMDILKKFRIGRV